MAARGVDLDELHTEIVEGRVDLIRRSVTAANELIKDTELKLQDEDSSRLWREIAYGPETSGVQLAISAGEKEEPTEGGQSG